MEVVDNQTGEITEARPGPMQPALAAAIVKVMKGVKTLGKDDTNNFARYKFVSIDKFLEYTGPLMAEAGMFVLMNEDNYELKQHQAEGKTSGWVFVTYSITLGHESGAMWGPIKRHAIVPASGAQAFGSAQSYTLKQLLRGLFSIPTGDKDDPDLNETDESGMKLTQAAAAPRPRAVTSPPAAAPLAAAVQPAVDEQTKAESTAATKEAARADYNRIRANISKCSTLDELDAYLAKEQWTMDQITAISGGTQAQKMLNDFAMQVRERLSGMPEEVPI